MELNTDTRHLPRACIMMVDDDDIALTLVGDLLSEQGNYQFVPVFDSTEAIDTIEVEEPDVVLLDLNMPEIDGFQILRQIRRDPDFALLPVIVLTASEDAETKIKALHYGATDFLTKPVDESELLLRLRNMLAVKAYQERRTYFDELTRLPNKKRFEERLSWQLGMHAANRGTLSVVTIGIDRYSELEDSMGLATTESLVCTIASRIQNGLEGMESVVGLHQEETWQSLAYLDAGTFGFLLPGVDRAEVASEYIKKLQNAFQAPVQHCDQAIKVSVSAGVSVFPYDGKESQELLICAVEALSFARADEPESIEFYSQDINALARDFFRLETDLRQAVATQGLELHYQPKVNLSDRSIVGAEALLRWPHAERGLISPSVFIPIAEDCGLINEIGVWVIHEACRRNQEWRQQGLGDLQVSVNVSALQVEPQTLCRVIENALQESGLPAKLFAIEIREQLLMHEPEEKLELLREIRSLGVEIIIDDFGTGASSFSYLNKMPVTELNIDREFILDTPESKDAATLVKVIVGMAHGLGLKVMAEGVEEPSQLEFLHSLGCEYAQGFVFSEPLPPSAFAAYVSDQKS